MGTIVHKKYFLFYKPSKTWIGTAEIQQGWETVAFRSDVIELTERNGKNKPTAAPKPKVVKIKNPKQFVFHEYVPKQNVDEQGEFIADMINQIQDPLPIQEDTKDFQLNSSSEKIISEGTLEQMLEDQEMKFQKVETKVETMEVKVDPLSIHNNDGTEAAMEQAHKFTKICAEITQERQTEENRKSTANSLLLKYYDKILPYCQKCKGTFKTLEENLDHWKKIHQGEAVQFFCRFQDCTYSCTSNVDTIKNHIIDHLKETGKIMICPTCKKPQLKKSFPEHVAECVHNNHHPNGDGWYDVKVFNEIVTELKNAGEKMIKKWKSNGLPIGLYVKNVLRYCYRCEKHFPNYDDVVAHWLKDHSDQKMLVGCRLSGCPYSCDNDAQMKDHIMEHYQKAGLASKCPFCSKIVRNMKFHINLNHSGKAKKQRKEIDEKTIPCTLCKKMFVSEEQMQKHIQNIHLRTEWKCKYCTETFGDNLQLRKHVEEKHDDLKFYSCNICEKSFRNKASMKDHMKTHEEMPKSCVCEDCGKAYKNKAHLKMHIDAVHKMIQRYSCDQCDFKTHRSDKLKKHMIDHTGIFPHNCSTCGKGFKTRVELNNHEDTHLPDEQKYKFSCQFCGSMFTRKVNLNVHIKSHHLKDK